MTRCDCTLTGWCEDCYNREAQPARDELARIMAAEDRARLMTHMEQHPEWPMFPQLGEGEK